MGLLWRSVKHVWNYKLLGIKSFRNVATGTNLFLNEFVFFFYLLFLSKTPKYRYDSVTYLSGFDVSFKR